MYCTHNVSLYAFLTPVNNVLYVYICEENYIVYYVIKKKINTL